MTYRGRVLLKSVLAAYLMLSLSGVAWQLADILVKYLLVFFSLALVSFVYT